MDIDWVSFVIGVAASIAATLLVAVATWMTRARLQVTAGYTGPGFPSIGITATNRSLRAITVDELGILVDGKPVPLTPRKYDPHSDNYAYRLVRVAPLKSTSVELEPRRMEERAKLVIHQGFHTGIDLRGYAKAAGRTFLAPNSFTW